MSSKEPMYSAEQTLEQIWNDSGAEGELFDGNESEFEVYLASEDESDEFSADEAQGCGDGGNPTNRGRQRAARGTTPRDIPLTGNSGVQVQTEGFQPYNFFALFINNDLLKTTSQEDLVPLIGIQQT